MIHENRAAPDLNESGEPIVAAEAAGETALDDNQEEYLPGNPEAVHVRAKQRYQTMLTAQDQYATTGDWSVVLARAMRDLERSFEGLPNDAKEALVPTKVTVEDLLGRRGDVAIDLRKLSRGSECAERIEHLSCDMQSGHLIISFDYIDENKAHEIDEEASLSEATDIDSRLDSLDKERIADDWLEAQILFFRPGHELKHLVWSCGHDREASQRQADQLANRLNEVYRNAVENGDAKSRYALTHFDYSCQIGRQARMGGEFLGTIYPDDDRWLVMPT